jgi:hypothetical protein
MAASGETEPSVSTALCFLQRHRLLSPALAGQGSCCAQEKGSSHVILPKEQRQDGTVRPPVLFPRVDASAEGSKHLP